MAIRRAFFLILLFSHLSYAEPVKQGDTVTVITPDVSARLCPYPNCGQEQHITRIPKDTQLTVEGIKIVKVGGTVKWEVTWFEVTYKGKRGWVSIYNTDKQ